jgi:Tfp pilus assembly protein PilF
MKQICAKAYINMAVCFLKKGQWLSVKEQSAKALEFDENNLKGI